MSLKNLNNNHLTNAQATTADSALGTFEQALAPILVELTPKDRQRYGSINEQNKLFVNKVADFHRTQPALSAPDIDWAEFGRDLQSRSIVEGFINRLQTLLDGLNNAKTLYDYDNNQAALNDYSYTAYRAGRGAAGFENKQEELKQFFTRSRNEDDETPGNDPITPSPDDHAAEA